jgi:hypothetical protein
MLILFLFITYCQTFMDPGLLKVWFRQVSLYRLKIQDKSMAYLLYGKFDVIFVLPCIARLHILSTKMIYKLVFIPLLVW